MATTARRFLISGRVQGVGYRYFAVREARALDLRGWVRNLANGSVEAYAAGEPSQLDAFESHLRQGPVASDVQVVEVSESEVNAKIEGFQIR